MSEQRAVYQVPSNLLQSSQNSATLEPEQESIDLQNFERMLIPVLNWVRKAQGKKPVIVPKG